MAWLFFDIETTNGLSTDEDGADFPDASAAEHEARLSVLELAKDRLGDGLDEISIHVRNQSGFRILIVKASITVERALDSMTP